MLYFLATLACLSAFPLMAATIGNVEYQLPKVQQGWKIANELHGDGDIQSTTIIYVPENSTLEDAEESFSAHTNDLPSMGLDQSSLKDAFDLQFPGVQLHLSVLESDTKSTLFELSTSNENISIYSLIRAFDTEQGSVLLMYQTNKTEQLESNRAGLLQSLKDAKLM